MWIVKKVFPTWEEVETSSDKEFFEEITMKYFRTNFKKEVISFKKERNEN